MKNLLSISDLDQAGIIEVCDLTDSFLTVTHRDIPKVPALRGKTVASVFYEDSTRTRLSFETAAKRLSADVMTMNMSSSSVQKGESLRDTVQTIEAMGVDAIVIRHRHAGAPNQVATWVDLSVINAGDGRTQHGIIIGHGQHGIPLLHAGKRPPRGYTRNGDTFPPALSLDWDAGTAWPMWARA